MTIADLVLYRLVSWLEGTLEAGFDCGKLQRINSSILNNYPLLRQHRESIDKIPSIVGFHKRFQAPYSTFDFTPEEEEPQKSNRKKAINRPKRVRLTKSDGFPKNVSRSRSADQMPKLRRRPSLEENDPTVSLAPKNTDKMIARPIQRKASFDCDAVEEIDDPTSKTRGASMPPRLRSIILDDDDDDDVNFSDDVSDTDDLNVSSTSLLSFSGRDMFISSPRKQKSDEFWDDSSSTSFDDESSFSSIERELENFKNSLPSLLKKESGVSSPPLQVLPLPPSGLRVNGDQAAKKTRRKKASRIKRKSKAANEKRATRPKLPANTPRHLPPKKKQGKLIGKKEPPADSTRDLSKPVPSIKRKKISNDN